MRWTAILLVTFGACAGPTQQQLAETPSAMAHANSAEAPPASTSDKDRERAVQQWDDMETTQRAHREARQESAPPAPHKASAPKKKGPAEQASLPKKPAEPEPAASR